MKRTVAVIGVLIALFTSKLQAGEIHDAAATGDLNNVKALLEADPTLLESKDDNGFTPLAKACFTRQVAVANFLLGKGADVKVKDIYQSTPLHRASYVAGQDLALLQRIIDKGADVNAQQYNGLTPLHWAAKSGDLKVAKLLMDHGADPNAYDKYSGPIGSASISGTILQVAINYGPNEDMAKLLVERGAKLNKKDPSGNTELHLAAMKGYAGLAQLLVEHGADVNIPNQHSRTALYYATKLGYRRTADALIAGGAKKSAIVETNYGRAPQLTATLKEGEAYFWSLGNFAYAVKTKGHLLLFNPKGINESLEAGLANGHLNPNELAGLKITVLITYQDRWPIGPEMFEVAKRIQGIDFVVSHKPSADSTSMPPYRLAVPNESFSVGGIQVRTIPAVFGGMGYLVEADKVKIFHAGLHAGGNDPLLMDKYRKEIDFLKPFGPIDVAILTVHDHSSSPVGVAYEPYLYLFDQLSPKAVYLTGANNPEQYTKCAEVLRVRNIPVAYPEGGQAEGDRFHYLRDRTAEAQPSGKPAASSDSTGS